jgi:hypothetical protein
VPFPEEEDYSLEADETLNSVTAGIDASGNTKGYRRGVYKALSAGLLRLVFR